MFPKFYSVVVFHHKTQQAFPLKSGNRRGSEPGDKISNRATEYQVGKHPQ